MARRGYHNTPKGKLYASEWPEWHVECGHPGCEESALVAGLGEAMTLKDAEKEARERASKEFYELNGWSKSKGFWYCPKHSKKLE